MFISHLFTCVLYVAVDPHVVDDGAFLDVLQQDLLQVGPVDHAGVWERVPLREVGDGVEDGVPGVSDALACVRVRECV